MRRELNVPNVSNKRGFTLIELLVTIAIIAILAGIAYPIYTAQVLKAHRTEAQVALNEIALAQERYFTVNGRYGTAVQLGDAYDDALNKMTDKNGDGNPDYYAVNMVPEASTFRITATAQGVQAEDGDCATLALNQAGAREATGDDPEKCW